MNNGTNGSGPQVNGLQMKHLVPVDQVLVKRLQQRVGARRGRALEEFRRNAQTIPTGEDARQHTEALLASVLTEYESDLAENGREPLEEQARVRLESALKARLFGAGNLEQLLVDPEVEDIIINGWRNVFVTYATGTKAQLQPVASSDKELEEIVKTISAHDGLSTRPFDVLNYDVTLRLRDGSRLHAVQGVTATGLSISIRKHRHSRATLLPLPGLAVREREAGVPEAKRTKDLLSEGTVDAELAAFLAALVRARMNIMVAGAVGAGKTTTLRALASEIDPIERLITVERSIELGLHEDGERHPDMVALEERLPNVDGAGAVGLADLVRNSLRMNPSRVIVGEVLGDEVITMLNAMMQGNDGSVSTIHANSSRDVIAKIQTYALQAKERLPFEATNGLIAGALDFIVFMRRIPTPDGGQRRIIESVREIAGRDEDGVKTTELWAFDRATGRTRFTRKAIMREAELLEVGWDPDGSRGVGGFGESTGTDGEVGWQI
ncbi:MAG: ATPase, T2SS/T4P/T4SS family [Nocardioides sp.]